MPRHLSTLFHYRWALPVLVELYWLEAAKFARLAHRFSSSRQTLRATLRGLVEQQLVTVRKGRYGSSLRDEYALTPRGITVARAGGALLFTIYRQRIQGWALRKWSLALVLALVAGPMGFNQLARSQETISDRALARALAGLRREGIIARHVTDACPPGTRYWLARRAWPAVGLLLPLLARFDRALSQ